DLLVLPSLPTATFREPWGLVINEAMLQRTPVIASDAVGAAAGGLVVDGATGAVFPAGDERSLARSLSVLADDRMLRARLGEQARERALALDPRAWADGMRAALVSAGVGR
ncbi:MAG: glycosyltransferase, partial [Thermoleophilaceae bacterium]